jgi:hypothetical protein
VHMCKIPWLASAITISYFVASVGLIRLLEFSVPAWLEQIISLVAAPGIILLTIWNPVLKRLGMVSGEWVVVPSIGGFLVLVSGYAIIAYALTWLVCRVPFR